MPLPDMSRIDLIDYANEVVHQDDDLKAEEYKALLAELAGRFSVVDDKMEGLEYELQLAKEGLEYTMEELEQAIEQGYNPLTSTKQMLRLIKDSND